MNNDDAGKTMQEWSDEAILEHYNVVDKLMKPYGKDAFDKLELTVGAVGTASYIKRLEKEAIKRNLICLLL